MTDDGDVWSLRIEPLPGDADLHRCFEEIMPRQTDRFIGETLAKGGLPEGLRRFLEDLRDGEFEEHDAYYAFSTILMAVALRALDARDGLLPRAPDLETSILVVGGVIGVNKMWESFVGDPRNAGFSDERPAGEWMVHVLRLDDLLQAGIAIVAKEEIEHPLSIESVRILFESAVTRLFAGTAVR